MGFSDLSGLAIEHDPLVIQYKNLNCLSVIRNEP
jgi:hypothetical protein